MEQITITKDSKKVTKPKLGTFSISPKDMMMIINRPCPYFSKKVNDSYKYNNNNNNGLSENQYGFMQQ